VVSLVIVVLAVFGRTHTHTHTDATKCLTPTTVVSVSNNDNDNERPKSTKERSNNKGILKESHLNMTKGVVTKHDLLKI